MRSAFALCVSFLIFAASAYADHGKGSIGGKTVSPRTLHENDASLEIGLRYQEAEAIPQDRFIEKAMEGHDVHNVSWLLEYSLSLSYGVTDRLTLSAGVPYSILHNFRSGADDGLGNFVEERAHEIAGVGDATVQAKYSLLSDPLEVAVIVGLKIPTGATDEKLDSDDLVEPDHQPGSGSWDPILGFAVGKQVEERLYLDGSFVARITTEGQHRFRPGRSLQGALRAEYQITALGSFPRLYGAFEVVGEYFGRDKKANDVNRDTGGFILQVGPGLKVRIDNRVSVAAGLYVPVYQNLFGEQHHERFEFMTGIVVDF